MPNPFDIKLTGLHFVLRAGGGYDMVRIDPSFRPAIGDRVTLGDDDSVEKSVPFGFRFYGTTQPVAFVNSDGNITFGEADRSSSDRNIARLLEGAPRVAPFLADLDPSVARARARRRRRSPPRGAAYVCSARTAWSRCRRRSSRMERSR